LGKKKAKQTSIWVETTQLQAHTQHPFYSRVNEILEKAKFDGYAERICRKYYAECMGRPSITPGTYFRCFFIGYFEGIDSERGIAYRVSDSLGLREFLGLSLEERTPDHSTLSKTRRLMNLGTHKAVFRWALKQLAEEGLLSGKNLGVDGTTLKAKAALRSIVRRDDGHNYDEHVAQLMQAEGVEEATPEQRQRFDRKRKKSLSNRDWVNPHDAEARITKMKDGRTHLAYKAEQVVDLDTGAVVALGIQPGDQGDSESMRETRSAAGMAIPTLAGTEARENAMGPCEGVSATGVARVVGDKGYHSRDSVRALAEVGVRTVIREPERGPQHWGGQAAERQAVYANRRRLQSPTGKELLRRRGEYLERAGAHLYDRGGMRCVTSAGQAEHCQASSGACGCFQSELDSAHGAGCRHSSAGCGPAGNCLFLVSMARRGQTAPALASNVSDLWRQPPLAPPRTCRISLYPRAVSTRRTTSMSISTPKANEIC
jgi:transposase